jgi:hypothetical protein
MPQFNTHAPKSASTLRNQIKMQSLDLDMQSKPIGVISENFDYSFYYDGESYRVSVGFFCYLAVGRSRMTFEQARTLYNACLFEGLEPVNFDFDKCIKAFKTIKRSTLTGDNLMFLWIDLLS